MRASAEQKDVRQSKKSIEVMIKVKLLGVRVLFIEEGLGVSACKLTATELFDREKYPRERLGISESRVN